MPPVHTRPTSRRSVLRTTGAAAAGLGLASTVVAADDDSDARCEAAFEYDTVVDVTEAGADPTGADPVDPVVEAHTANDTLLYFPEGEYLVERLDFADLANFGLCGPDATLVAPATATGNWITTDDVVNFQFEGFTLDHTADGAGPSVRLYADDGLLVRDIHKVGLHQSGSRAFRFQIDTEAGAGLVERLRATDGTDSGANGILITGPSSRVFHEGHLTFKHCEIEGFMDNGLYASGPTHPASIHVIGGRYANNNISNIRLGQPNSLVKNARVELTEIPDYWPPLEDGTFVGQSYGINMRGMRLQEVSGQEVKNCELLVTEDVPSGGAIVVETDAGRTTIKNTHIHVDAPAGINAINARFPIDYVDAPAELTDDTAGIVVKNVRITGDGYAELDPDEWGSNSAVWMVHRGECTFENLCIEQPGDGRNGLDFWGNSFGRVSNAVIDVDGQPIIDTLEDDGVAADVETHNVREEGECPPE